MALHITCPTCEGRGEVSIDIEDKDGKVWTAYCGDKDLWDAYSHASVKGHRGTWSNFFPIASFYRYDEDFTINLHGDGGSWPNVSEKDLKTKFRLLDRKTGEETPFVVPVLQSLEKTIKAMMKCDTRSEDRMEALIKRLGFKASKREIWEIMRAVKQTLDKK